MKRLLVMMAFLAAAAAFGQSPAQTPAPASYENKEYGVSFSVPEGWSVADDATTEKYAKAMKLGAAQKLLWLAMRSVPGETLQRLIFVAESLPSNITGPVNGVRYIESWLKANPQYTQAADTPGLWDHGSFYRADLVTTSQPEHRIVMLLATRKNVFYHLQLEVNSAQQVDEVLNALRVTIPPGSEDQFIRVPESEAHAYILKWVPPVYPDDARHGRIQGSVVLGLDVMADGRVVNVHVVRGHPMLVQAALNAVKQWKFKPYEVNGQPVNMSTTVTINFTLSGM